MGQVPSTGARQAGHGAAWCVLRCVGTGSWIPGLADVRLGRAGRCAAGTGSFVLCC